MIKYFTILGIIAILIMFGIYQLSEYGFDQIMLSLKTKELVENKYSTNELNTKFKPNLENIQNENKDNDTILNNKTKNYTDKFIVIKKEEIRRYIGKNSETLSSEIGQPRRVVSEGKYKYIMYEKYTFIVCNGTIIGCSDNSL